MVNSYVVSLLYYDLNTATEREVLFGTSGFTTRPTDTPANTTVQGRVITPALVRFDVFDIGTIGGASRVAYGEVVLRNDDGALDWLNNVALDGRTLRVRVAPNVQAAYPSEYTTLLTATMEEVEITLSEVRIRIRNRQVFASRALQTARYAGSNVLPAGLEGLASDLQGKPKPILYGACFNVEPVAVNTSRLVYQVNDGAVRDVTAVYDSGALLTHGADYATEAAMMAAGSPTAGKFRVWKAGGMFRLGASPVGQVTCDAVEGLNPTERTAAQVFRRLVLERTDRANADIDAADLVLLDSLQRATLGVYFSAEVTVNVALDTIARSVGAGWGDDVHGVLRIRRLQAASGTVNALQLHAGNIRENELRRVPLNDGGLPVYRVTVRCVPNYTVQTSGLVGSVTQSRRARLAQPYQDGSATNFTIQDAYLLSPEKVVLTQLSCRGAGQAEAERLLVLYGTKRDRFEVVAQLTFAELSLIELYGEVHVTYARYGLQAGKVFIALGYQLNPTDGSVSLTLWG